MISLDLFEKKLSQLNQQHVSKTKDLEKAMHSQGIDPGEPKRDAHHVQYPKATFRRSGKPAHGITAVDDGKGKLTSSTGGNTVRDAVLKSGRVDKRPAAKAERAKEAAENRATKKKNRKATVSVVEIVTNLFAIAKKKTSPQTLTTFLFYWVRKAKRKFGFQSL